MIYVLNTGFSSILCFACSGSIPQELSGICAFAYLAACISQAALLNLLPLLAASCLSRISSISRRIIWGTIFSLFQILLLFNVIIFRLFSRHFDGMVWSVISSPGASEVLRPGMATVLWTSALALTILGGGLAVAFLAVPNLVVNPSGGRLLHRSLCAILLLTITERAVFAVVSLKDFVIIESVRSAIPFYQPFTVKKIARKLGYNVEYGYHSKISINEMTVSNRRLKLPRSPLGPRLDLRHPNILIIAIEGARSDALDAVCMPNVNRLAENAWYLPNHFSTGNETRFGLFGIFYGILGSYYSSALSSCTPSPLIELLKQQKYQFIIRSSADLSYTGCNRTAFLSLADEVKDRWTGLSVERDKMMTDSFLAFLSTRPELGRPFFGFLFYDASHQPYQFPPEDAVFPAEITSGDINYAKIAFNPSMVSKLKPLYKNSLHYVDRQIGRVLAELSNRGELNNTILVIVGDHGEEFGESGHFGHTSAFNRFQTQTLAVLRFPDQPAHRVERLTSHMDIVPSILTWMGVTNALSDYTTGIPIQADISRTAVTLSGWQTLALVKTNSFMVFGPFSSKLYDYNGSSLKSDDSRRPTGSDMAELMRQSRCFFE